MWDIENETGSFVQYCCKNFLSFFHVIHFKVEKINECISCNTHKGLIK